MRVFTTEATEGTEKNLRERIDAPADFVGNRNSPYWCGKTLKGGRAIRDCTVVETFLEKVFSVPFVSSVVNISGAAPRGRSRPCF